ncbi:MAG: hypothetical protein ACTS5P_01760 [Candidatus Hodgkinia cicadicola]
MHSLIESSYLSLATRAVGANWVRALTKSFIFVNANFKRSVVPLLSFIWSVPKTLASVGSLNNFQSNSSPRPCYDWSFAIVRSYSEGRGVRFASIERNAPPRVNMWRTFVLQLRCFVISLVSDRSADLYHQSIYL